VITLLRLVAPGRSDHEQEFMRHLASTVADSENLASITGRLVSVGALRKMTEPDRSALLDVLGFRYHDYFLVTLADFDAAQYRAWGAASVIRGGKQD
jgi:hypothetical protein